MSEENYKPQFKYMSYKEKFDRFSQVGRTPYVGVDAQEAYVPVSASSPEGDIADAAAADLANEQVVAGTDPNEKLATDANRKISRSANTHLESKSVVKIVDLISEGPIEGFCSQNGDTITYFGEEGNKFQRENIFQSVYFDGTRILNPEIGTLNYRFPQINFKFGTGFQSPLGPDYQFASQTIPINARLTPAPLVVDGSKRHIKELLIPQVGGGDSTEGKEMIKDWSDNKHSDIKSVRDLTALFRGFERMLEPIVHTIQNPLVEEITINIKIHVLSRLKVGKRSSKVVGAECSFLIYIGNESGDFNPLTPVLCEGSPGNVARLTSGDENRGNILLRNQTGGYFVRIARGLATSDYVFETKFHLPPNFRRENRVIRVFRLEYDQGYEAEDPQVECSLESIVESIPFKLRYPYSAVIGAQIDSTTIARIPKREYDLKLLKVKIPSNYIPDTKQYFGNWSGRFKDYVAVLDETTAKELRVKRPLSAVTNRAKSDGTKQVKVSTSVKKYGSGSIFFPTASGLSRDEDWAKRISVHNRNAVFPIEKEDSPKNVLRVSDFGFQNFTIEFYIKVEQDGLVKTYTSGKGGPYNTSSGQQGFYKTIISSGGGIAPFGGSVQTESDDNRNNNELYKHPSGRKELNYSAGIKEQGSLPVAGNWFVEIGTELNGELGQIIFRYFTHGAYYRPLAGDYQKVEVLDTGGKPTTALQVLVKSTTNVADDEWHHVAITRQGNKFNVWVDGTDRTDEGDKTTYEGDIRGFVYTSGTQKNTGAIEIGNDRIIHSSPSNSEHGLHSSFEGYLDYIHITRRCKYTVSGFDTSPSKASDLIQNEQQSVVLLSGDGQPNNGTKIKDFNPTLVVPKEAMAYFEKHGTTHLQWTDNPAWIFYDLITNKRYGLGKYGINTDFVNKWNIYELGKYCDELVKTGWPSRFPHRNFQVVTDARGDAASTGEIYIKINGFDTQGQFLGEFPRFSTIAIFDLDNGARPVKRVVEYIQVDGEIIDKDGDTKFHSWIGENGTEKPGSAVIKLLRPVSLDECFLLNPQLKEYIMNEQYKTTDKVTTRDPNVTPKSIIYKRYAEYGKNKLNGSFTELPGDAQIIDFFFDGQKINSTSASGRCATEFRKSREILEPRFTANLYLTTAVDAFKVLNDLSSVFLGLTYIVGGKVFASFDKPRDPIMNFTNSNVKDGSFTYAGSPKTSRFTTALVRYVDKYENFKPKVEYVEDAGGIIKYGLIEKELVAFGCTSRGQARRLGKWFLFSAQLETDSVQFTTGKEASYLRPGDVVKIIDKNKTRKRYGGRITNINNERREVTLDAQVDENVVGQIITIAIPSSFQTEESLDQAASTKGGASDGDLKDLRKPQIKEFKVSSVNTDRKVPNQRTILTLTELNDENAQGVGLLKPGAIWILQNTDVDLRIQEVLYRVMNIEEENSMQYKVSCLEYNKSKFAASEDDSQADKANVSVLAIGGSGQIDKAVQSKATGDAATEGSATQPGEDPVDLTDYEIEGLNAVYTPFQPGDSTYGEPSTRRFVQISWKAPKKPASAAGSLLKKYRISWTYTGVDGWTETKNQDIKALDSKGQDVVDFSRLGAGDAVANSAASNSKFVQSVESDKGLILDVKISCLIGSDMKNLEEVNVVQAGFTFKKKN